MAELLGARKRGRKPEQLRLTAREIVAGLTTPGKPVEVEVELVPGEGRRKGESVTLEIPKGAAVVPFAITRDKSDENAREQIRLAAADVARKVAIRSHAVRLDDGTEAVVWHVLLAD